MYFKKEEVMKLISKPYAEGVKFSEVGKIKKYGSLGNSIEVPEWVLHVQHLFFNDLSQEQKDDLSYTILESVSDGCNLEPVKYKFFSFILIKCIDVFNNKDGDQRFMSEKEDLIKMLTSMLGLLEKALMIKVWEVEKNSMLVSSNEISLFSETLRMALSGVVSEQDFNATYVQCYEKLIDLLKSSRGARLSKESDCESYKKLINFSSMPIFVRNDNSLKRFTRRLIQ